MSELKHTPGSWTMRVAGNGDCGISAEGTGVFAEAFAEIRHSGENAREEARANGFLISAAPDLLALAFQYRDDLLHPPASDSKQRRLEAIETVISKATA